MLWLFVVLVTLWLLTTRVGHRSRRVMALVAVCVVSISPLVLAEPLHRLLSAGPSPATATGWAVAALPAVGLWAWAARWARREPEPPMVDAARVRWDPRSSHRATWVLAVGFTTAVIAGLFAIDHTGLAGLLGMAFVAACTWAHRGQRGPVVIETRDLVLGGQRIPLANIAAVQREVGFLGPIRRERIAVIHEEGSTHHLISGSPEEHTDAVLWLLDVQRRWSDEHPLERPEQLPSPDLRQLLGHVDQRRRAEIPVGTDGPAT
ncbi:MAG: hypothetical protein KTR31_30260 [Myxococcales bacterium]|nr:hypothetical protein [Myxococcales bacterium]